MLNNRTPDSWKKHCKLYATRAVKDRYNSEKLVTDGDAIPLDILPLPVNDRAVLEEYGIKYDRSLQAVLYDEEVKVRHFYQIEIDSVMYSVVGIKRYPSYRLLIMERVKHGEKCV